MKNKLAVQGVYGTILPSLLEWYESNIRYHHLILNLFPPKTNIEPENEPLEEKSLFKNYPSFSASMWAKFVEFSTFPNCLILCNFQNLWTPENSGGESTDNGPPASVFRTVLGAQEGCETWQGITKVILLMEEILHPLLDSWSGFWMVLIHPRWKAGFLSSTVSCKI